MDSLSIPEQAISAFERVHDVLVTVHDFSGRIKQRLAINRTFHRHALCHAAKARDNERGCLAFDLVALHAQAPLHPQGFLQRCHAGLVEAVVPIRVDGEVMGIVMAGVRAQGSHELPLTRSLPQAPDIAKPNLPSWTPEHALTVLECLRQLAARLEVWLAATEGDGAVGATDRRSTILHVISHGAPKGVTLPQLAARLGLSVDRTGHVVREEFGITFLDLVNQHRLERAAALLRHSDLPIATIALNSGFGDVSTFHRRFRTQFKMTPRAFRMDEKAKKKG